MRFALLFIFSSILSLLPLLGQVPAEEASAESTLAIPVASSDPTDNLSLGILTDPAELSLIDGLDEPLERLRLRDQDSNMILDMIQMITGRYILRPQNLPQVKITFDSMSVLSKRETLSALESLLAMNGVGISLAW